MGALPNVIVIGVSKCGTSALHHFLDFHPEISMSIPKEPNFFMDGVEIDGRVPLDSPEEIGMIEAAERNWSRGLDWYKAHFNAKAPIRGESSARYTAPWFPGVPERIASVVPDAKLILMVRDPLPRALSHHAFQFAEGLEPRAADEAFANPNNVYLARSMYFEQLSRFRECFPSSSIMVVAQEDLHARPERTMQSVFAFLGVDDNFSTPKFTRQVNRTGTKGRAYRAAQRMLKMPGMRIGYRLPHGVRWRLEWLLSRSQPGRVARTPLDDPLRTTLLERLRPDADRFREATGREFPEWSV